jgi:hypothetical protein
MSHDVSGNSDLATVRNPYDFLLLPSLQSDSLAAQKAQGFSKTEKIRQQWRIFGGLGFAAGIVLTATHAVSGWVGFVFSTLPIVAELGALLFVAIVRRRERAHLQQSGPFSLSPGKTR